MAVVLDLYSQRVVGWSMQSPTLLIQDRVKHLAGKHRRRQSTNSLQMLKSVVLRRPVEFAQYTSEDFQRLLESHGITCSMSRRGNCWDNAAMESFFSTLKTERLGRRQYRTRNELRADVFDYIERFYNPKRRHSTIGYISPVQFENLQCA